MKVGLVLSGGGVRGVAHLGVIKALEENDVTIDCISGSSAGAIVGALYAAGHDVLDILDIITQIKTFRLLQPAMSWKGILTMEVVEKFLEKYLPADDFDDLKIPLYVTATNLRTGKSESFNQGRLRRVICASSCIPVMFNPVVYNGELYIDGGILNNLPVDPIREQCDFIIGSHSNPVDDNFDPRNVRVVMERALMMAITQNVYQRKSSCDFFIEPKGLEPYKVMDLAKATEIYEIGYEYTKQQIEKENLLDHL
ncbi:patatin [Fulvivirga sp. RKSG066]|uniref:patatin-like phospholipase family protein n=1 Tax=Fulvivirga aurantia TaxID=2529383 RepID=UPI0012BCCB3E|nr:patatin-like phospholipase family protein [Fulvivirga aurantia]MTI21545.1 patatin [Fulvivirga aurantia]